MVLRLASIGEWDGRRSRHGSREACGGYCIYLEWSGGVAPASVRPQYLSGPRHCTPHGLISYRSLNRHPLYPLSSFFIKISSTRLIKNLPRMAPPHDPTANSAISR